MTIEELKQILPLLIQSKVTTFKMEGLELSFEPSAKAPDVQSPPLAPITEIPVKLEESSLPPDLRTDAITDYDKILNWSGTPDPGDEPQMPLTGDMPL